MYLVKSCESQFNVLTSKTINIGSLDYYRRISEKQIQDPDEGKIKIEFNFSNLYMDPEMGKMLFNHNGAHIQLYFHEMFMEHSHPVIGDISYLHGKGEGEFTHHNQLAFCISKLERHHDATGLFKDYHDYWYFNYDKRFLIAQEMAKEIRNKITNNIKNQKWEMKNDYLFMDNGELAFKEKIDLDSLQVWFKIQEITYVDRKLDIDNNFYYNHREEIERLISGMCFLKPSHFAPENEIRFLFSISSNGAYISPLFESLIIENGNINIFVKRKN